MSTSAPRALLGVASVVMVAAIAGGWYVLGSPAHQRALALDQRRVSDLTMIETMIGVYRNGHANLPESLQTLEGNGSAQYPRDPVTGTAYEYTATDANDYMLCARFDLASEPEGQTYFAWMPDGRGAWQHPAGRYCFKRHASK